ncbi:ATP-binding protein [Rasiella sp. SM2506]|uniref:ATP-binding protein n=1 Tax=Rasiella sp. SM2506 TaxID=3423914 RepID=UPI003D7BF07B
MLFSNIICSQEALPTKTGISPTEIWKAGIPYIENYSTTDYKSSPQNWAFIEGNDGFMYLGNTDGVLQFDGTSWNLIKLKNKSLVRSLATAEDEKIYVGGVQELGYLEPDGLGEMKFNSLKYYLNSENHDFMDVFAVEVTGKQVFYSSDKYLFRWDGEAFKVWKPKERFGSVFKVNNTLFIDSKGVGLHKIDGDSLTLMKGGDLLINERSKLEGMLPYATNEVLFINASRGLTVFNGEKLTPLNLESNEVFQKNRIYKSIRLSDGDYAMATLSSGLYIVDGKTGEIKKKLGKKEGLSSDVLYSVYQDRFGSIWVGSDNGVSRVHWTSPFRSFNNLNGLDERVRSARYHNGNLLVDSKGLYQLVRPTGENELNGPSFKKIEGIENTIKFIVPYNEEILAFNAGFAYIIDKKNTIQFVKRHDFTLTSILKSKVDSTKIYAGTMDGKLLESELENKEWKVVSEPLLQINGGIESITEEPNGNLWLETYLDGLYFAEKVSDNRNERIRFELTKHDTLSGLPSMTYNKPYLLDDKLFITTEDGMYTFNQLDKRFVKDSLLNNQYDKAVDTYGYLGLAKDGTIWQTVRAGSENKVYTYTEDILTELQAYKLYSDFDTYSMEFLEDVILFLGPKGILAYHENAVKTLPHKLNTNIRKVWINNDSLVFSGSNLSKNTGENIEFPFTQNSLKFEYTLPFYSNSKNNVYQSFLVGFDTQWSSWSSETKKNYTNLPSGAYTFKVRSKNIFNQPGDEASYMFTIRTPWYSTWWAYLLYGVSLLFLVLVIIRWRSKELKKQNKKLEETIAQRTLEIQHKNEILNHQTEKLVELNEVKTRLFSNISHEFRTPLTVILGMTDTLKSDFDNQIFKNTEKSLEMIRRNGKNLLHLVNELLDLAKIESGAMELELVQTDVVPFIKYFSESFHSLAEAKNINLTVYSEIEAQYMDIDINKLGAIISNLLSNAIKFTPENGKIIVHLNKIEQQEKQFLTIKVKDNGEGMTEKDLVHVFDRFYQVANNLQGHQIGTGIGLSLTKEFVELMNGAISAESSIGKGSTFTVEIPITHTAVKNEKPTNTLEPAFREAPPTNKKELSLEASTSDLPLLLIIEDNIDVALYLETCLQDKYQTIHALDGAIGMNMAFENIPDIIISDVMMPNKNGYEVCADLKADERTDHIPIILLTAKVTTEDRLTGLTHGADAYLGKPFNKEELFTRLNQLILVRKKLIRKLEQLGFSSVLNEKVENPQTKFVQQVIKIVLTHLDDVTFGPTMLAAEMHLSESQIYRKLKSITDTSTAVFIRSVRLQKAKELLQTSNKTVSEIAYEVGFNDPSWFSRSFKEEFGAPPSDYSK